MPVTLRGADALAPAPAPRRAPVEPVQARALYEITQEICSRLDLEEVLSAIVRRARQMLRSDVAYLATNDERLEVLRVRAFDNVRSELFKRMRVPHGIGVGGLVAARNEVVGSDDYLTDSSVRHIAEVDAAVAEEGLRSVIAAPVMYEGRLLGVLFAARRRSGRFSDHHRTLLAGLGNSAAIAINNAQIHSQVTRAMTIHQRLMEVVLAEKGVGAIAGALADLIQGPVVLLDWCAQPLAEAAFAGRRLRIPDPEAVLRDAAAGVDTGFGVTPITLTGAVEGHLLVEARTESLNLDEVAVEQASTVFALELAKMRSAEQAELQLRGDLLDELMARPLVNEASVVRWAARVGIDLRSPLTVVLSRVADVDMAADPGWERSRHRLLPVGLSLARRAAAGSLVVWKGDALVFVVPGVPEKRAALLASRFIVEARAAASEDVVVGIGGPSQTPGDFARAFDEASRAAGAARSLPGLGPVVKYSDLAFHQLVLGTRPGGDLRRMAGRLLAPLRQYDDTHGPTLLPTIQAFIECGGSLEATRTRLGIHVNTLRGRLQRIAALLGRDLGDAKTRVDLLLAIEVTALSE